MNWKSAIIGSAIVATLATIVHQVISTGGAYYFAPVDWEIVNELRYSEAQEYIAERSRNYTRWESLMNSIHYSHFWLGAAVEYFFLWLFGIACCWLSNRASYA